MIRYQQPLLLHDERLSSLQGEAVNFNIKRWCDDVGVRGTIITR